MLFIAVFATQSCPLELAEGFRDVLDERLVLKLAQRVLEPCACRLCALKPPEPAQKPTKRCSYLGVVGVVKFAQVLEAHSKVLGCMTAWFERET